LNNLPPLIWVVLPAYNEGHGLCLLYADLLAQLEGMQFQVVVVDDGSTDGSMEALMAYHFSPAPIILRHEKNQGLGKALDTGFRYVIAQENLPNACVVVMDADQTHPPDLIPEMVSRLTDTDIVIASRYQLGAQVIGLSAYRKLLSLGASFLFRLVVPVPNVADYTCGFRAYKLSRLQESYAQYGESFILERGFTCMAEVLIKLTALNCRCAEVPLILRYDQKISTSKMRVFKTVMAALPLLLKHHRQPTAGQK